MSNQYRNTPTEQLEKMWNDKRLSLAIGAKGRDFQKDLDAVFEMRQELDRRKGERLPTTSIEFSEEYTTD